MTKRVIMILALIGGSTAFMANLIHDSRTVANTLRLMANVPRITIGGHIDNRDLVPAPSHPVVTLLWVTQHPNGPRYHQGDFVRLVFDSGQLHYELPLSDEPPYMALNTERGLQVGIAYVVLFDDKDGNGILALGQDTIAARSFWTVRYVRELGQSHPRHKGNAVTSAGRNIPIGYSAIPMSEEYRFLRRRFQLREQFDIHLVDRSRS